MKRSFTQLSQDERRTLAQLLQKQIPKVRIAEILGRDRSTIYREIKRNWWRDTEIPEADFTGAIGLEAAFFDDEETKEAILSSALIASSS